MRLEVAGAAAACEAGRHAEEQTEEPEPRAPVARVLARLAVDAHEGVAAAWREQRLVDEFEERQADAQE